jgi:ABC-type Fe3+-hydroxamate transport system substrate-binding protein
MVRTILLSIAAAVLMSACGPEDQTPEEGTQGGARVATRTATVAGGQTVELAPSGLDADQLAAMRPGLETLRAR